MIVVLVLNGPANAAERAILARREPAFLRELASLGVRVTVVLFGDAGHLAPELEAAGATVSVLPAAMAPRASSLVRILSAARKLRAILDRVVPDVVEATEPMPAIAAGIAGRRRHVVLYRRQHPDGSRKLNAASWVAARLCKRTIVSNEAMRRVAADADGTPLDRILVAPTGTVEPVLPTREAIAAARQHLGIADGVPVVVAISRLRWEKGLDVLVAAADHVGSPCEVVIVGAGVEEQRLRELAATSRTRIHFAGHRDDVALWFALANVLVIPSRRESMGRTTLEAMAAGCAIVASRVGGLVEAIRDGENGLLVTPGDPVALAAALHGVLTDAALAATLRRGARAHYESRFTIGQMARARRDAWQEALRSATA